MHAEVLSWVDESMNWWAEKPSKKLNVLEFGSLDINGSVRSILESTSERYVGVDVNFGKGVDVVGDASVFRDIDLFDVVVCCEVFEHTPLWKTIILNAYNNLVPGGLFICTMAGLGRPPHSALDENPIREWEFYGNVSERELSQELQLFSRYETNVVNFDTRGRAVK